MPQHLPILMYHKIGQPSRETIIKGLSVSPAALKKQLKRLKELGFAFCDFEDLQNYIDGEKPMPVKPIILTFDDGHLDNYSIGLPIFKEFRVKATIFVIAGEMGKKEIVWEDAKERSPANLMSWDQAREMIRFGISINDHGLFHHKFNELPLDVISAELKESRRLIEHETGKVPIAFAYPYGVFNDSSKSLIKEIGYRFAVSIINGVCELGVSDYFAMPRIPIRGYRWHHDWQFNSLSAGWIK